MLHDNQMVVKHVRKEGKTQYLVKPNTNFNTTIFLEIIYNGNRYESRPIRRLRFCRRCREKTVSFKYVSNTQLLLYHPSTYASAAVTAPHLHATTSPPRRRRRQQHPTCMQPLFRRGGSSTPPACNHHWVSMFSSVAKH